MTTNNITTRCDPIYALSNSSRATLFSRKYQSGLSQKSKNK